MLRGCKLCTHSVVQIPSDSTKQINQIVFAVLILTASQTCHLFGITSAKLDFVGLVVVIITVLVQKALHLSI